MLRDCEIEKVQEYFMHLDNSKFLKLHAQTQQQIERAEAFEKTINDTLKNLYAPTPTVTHR